MNKLEHSFKNLNLYCVLNLYQQYARCYDTMISENIVCALIQSCMGTNVNQIITQINVKL